MKNRIRDKAWYPYTVALCIAVVLAVVLTHLKPILGALAAFLKFFNSFFLGCILAYLINPLACFFKKTVFKKVKKEPLSWTLSVVLAFIVLFLVFQILLATLIPQLIESITMLLDNMEGYLASLSALIEHLGIAGISNLEQLLSPSADIVTTVVSFFRDNAGKIINISTDAGKNLVVLLIAVILSVYLLLAKESLKNGSARLLRALISPARYTKTVGFLTRCDTILSRYIVYSLLDSLIVGIANAIFMTCLHLEYVGLISLVVGVTNLIPTFGPVIGYVVGGFILLLVNPLHALIFLIFSFILQFLDGYVIKPKLFGDSLGVSGLLILVAVTVGGNMFGILGMLLAIPAAAILDFVYREELLPALENRKNR